MKRFLWSDLPVKVDVAFYEESVHRMVERLKKCEGCTSIYGIGGVSAPGISDLDVVLVTRNESELPMDFRAELSAKERYLFIHDLYGTSEFLFLEGQRFSFFKPYRLLYGEDLLFGINFPEPHALVRRQVALEYLLRFYLSITMQQEYKLLRVRSLLLNAKGAAIDIGYLAPSDLDGSRLIHQLNQLRSNWFASKRPPLDEMTVWFNAWVNWFVPFLRDQFNTVPFYLPENKKYVLGRNILMETGKILDVRAKVKRATWLYPVFGNRYFKLLNRFSRFDLMVPYQADEIPPAVSDYFEYNLRHRNYNRLHLTHCLPLTSSFNPR